MRCEAQGHLIKGWRTRHLLQWQMQSLSPAIDSAVKIAAGHTPSILPVAYAPLLRQKRLTNHLAKPSYLFGSWLVAGVCQLQPYGADIRSI